MNINRKVSTGTLTLIVVLLAPALRHAHAGGVYKSKMRIDPPALGLTSRAETLRFAWPDGASAKVNARSEGRQSRPDGEATWGMTCDFTMQVRRTGGRVTVSRNDFSGWKGTFPPAAAGGAERFTIMIPTFFVSDGGEFIGIEGHETARKLMSQSVGQSGGLDPASRSAFETFSSDAALRAIASDHWSALVGLWQGVELDPDMSYELRNVTAVPQLGGGELTITGTIQFVGETPCGSDGGGRRRCVNLRAETGADKAQVAKLLQSLLSRAGAGHPVVTALDQRFKVDIVVDKATMLPQRLTITRLHAMEMSVQGRSGKLSEEITTTYTFTWLVPGG